MAARDKVLGLIGPALSSRLIVVEVGSGLSTVGALRRQEGSARASPRRTVAPAGSRWPGQAEAVLEADANVRARMDRTRARRTHQ